MSSESTSDLMFVLRKAEGGEPLVNAVLVPVEDVVAVVHDRDNERRVN